MGWRDDLDAELRAEGLAVPVLGEDIDGSHVCAIDYDNRTLTLRNGVRKYWCAETEKRHAVADAAALERAELREAYRLIARHEARATGDTQ